MHTKATLVSFAAAAPLMVLGQLGGLSISQQCLTSLTGQLVAPDTSSCLAVSGLLPLLSTPADQSLVPVLAAYQTQLCAAPTCSNETVTGLVTAFFDGCSQDLEAQNVPITDSTRQTVLDNAPEVYNLIKDVACLRNATTSQSSGSSCADGSVFCLQDLLNNLETDLNVTLSINYLGELLGQLQSAGVSDVVNVVNELPTSTVCTDCNSAAYSLIESVFPGVANLTIGDTTFEQAAASKCGAEFPNAGIPTTVEQYTDYCPASSASSSPSRARLARWI